MTAADRLRAAVEAALPRPQTCKCEAADQRVCWMLKHGTDAGGWNPRCSCRCHLIPAVLAAALPIVEELERDAARYRHLRRNCQYGFDDHDYPQLIHRNGETGAHQNPRWREDLDAAIDAAMMGERDGE